MWWLKIDSSLLRGKKPPLFLKLVLLQGTQRTVAEGMYKKPSLSDLSLSLLLFLCVCVCVETEETASSLAERLKLVIIMSALSSHVKSLLFGVKLKQIKDKS